MKKAHLWSQCHHISHSAVRQTWTNGECLQPYKHSIVQAVYYQCVCVDVMLNKIQRQMTPLSFSLFFGCRAGRAPPHGRVKDYCVHPLIQKVSDQVHALYLNMQILEYLHHWYGLQSRALSWIPSSEACFWSSFLQRHVRKCLLKRSKPWTKPASFKNIQYTQTFGLK